MPKAKAKKADVAPVEDKAGDAPRFPLFYTAPRPLEAARHAKTTLSDDIGMRGSQANANAIPLNIVEFAVAARHYPLVFSNSAPFLAGCYYRAADGDKCIS